MAVSSCVRRTPIGAPRFDPTAAREPRHSHEVTAERSSSAATPPPPSPAPSPLEPSHLASKPTIALEVERPSASSNAGSVKHGPLVDAELLAMATEPPVVRMLSSVSSGQAEVIRERLRAARAAGRNFQLCVQLPLILAAVLIIAAGASLQLTAALATHAPAAAHGMLSSAGNTVSGAGVFWLLSSVLPAQPRAVRAAAVATALGSVVCGVVTARMLAGAVHALRASPVCAEPVRAAACWPAHLHVALVASCALQSAVVAIIIARGLIRRLPPRAMLETAWTALSVQLLLNVRRAARPAAVRRATRMRVVLRAARAAPHAPIRPWADARPRRPASSAAARACACSQRSRR